MRSGFKLNFIILSALFILIFSGCGKADTSLESEVEETFTDAADSVSDARHGICHNRAEGGR